MTRMPPKAAIHRPSSHESAIQHVTGLARYTDDLPDPVGLLHGWVVESPVARGRIRSLSIDETRLPPGSRVFTWRDVPGHNRLGAVVQDEPVLAEDEVVATGQAVAFVVAPSREEARLAAACVTLDIEVLPAILTIDDAIEQGAFLTAAHRVERGDIEQGFRDAAFVLEGDTRTPAQDHFYLETHNALTFLDEDGSMRVISSTQHPTETQHTVAHVLGWPAHRVVSQVIRMGGGFGGKESQSALYGALAAMATLATGRAVRVRLNRSQDMGSTGKRHPFLGRWRIGFHGDGTVSAWDVQLWSDGGWSTDLSAAVMDRAVLHSDGGCFMPNMRVVGRACRTNLPSNTAFRGFGGPQGLAMVWDAFSHAAVRLGLPVDEVFARNLYGPAPRDVAHYRQQVPDPRHRRMLPLLRETAEIERRRADISAWNALHPLEKRGLGVQPIQFGIAFGVSFLNQSGALVLVYADGSVQINHGGTEMGQGLHTKVRSVAASILGVDPGRVRVMTTSTDKVPNTSATAASVGSDLNGAAVRDACEQIKLRMAQVASTRLGAVETLEFEGGEVRGPEGKMPFDDLARQCWLERVSLSASGFYATPGVSYDRTVGYGTPHHYFAYGVCAAEVQVHGLTGEHRILRLDVLHDCGDSLNPAIDRGQIEGGLVQGIGWLTGEEVQVDGQGRVRSRGPSTYKVPSGGDVPRDFRVQILEADPQPGVVGGSKAVGEPPLLLAFAVCTALREAVRAWGDPGTLPAMTLPMTPEALLREISVRRGDRWGA